MWTCSAMRRIVGSCLIGSISSSRQFWLQSFGLCSSIESQIIEINPDFDQEPFTPSKEQEQLISRGDPQRERQLHELRQHLFLSRLNGIVLPSEINVHDVEFMMNQNNFQLEKYLNYLIFTLKNKKSARVLQNFKRGKNETVEHPWLEYELINNSLFPRIYERNISLLQDVTASKALQYGQKVVIDCSFEPYVDEQRIRIAARRIAYSHELNSRNIRPFSLNLCNLDPDGKLMRYLRSSYASIDKSGGMALHSSSYTDMFDTKDLVRISPDSNFYLKYHPSHIYILSAVANPNRYADVKKSFQEKVYCVTLPVNQYLKAKKERRRLFTDQYINILLTVKNSGDWYKALTENIDTPKYIERNKFF